MLVFIDESGDPGFKLTKGSSPIFVTTMVIFDAVEDAQEAQNVIRQCQLDLRVKPEFKFNKCKAAKKDKLFDCITPLTFRTRSVVVSKEVIYSDHLRTVKTSFYNFFIRQMIEKSEAALVDAKVVIDGSGDRVFKRQFKSYLRKNLDAKCIKTLSLKDSKKDHLVQLADMCAGAVARSYRTDRSDSGRWRHMLKRNGQIEDIWEFK